MPESAEGAPTSDLQCVGVLSTPDCVSLSASTLGSENASGSTLPAELVELYLQSGGSAAAFEERAQLPKGAVTGMQPHTATPKDATRPGEALLPSSSLSEGQQSQRPDPCSKQDAQLPQGALEKGRKRAGTECCNRTLGTLGTSQRVHSMHAGA